MQIDIEKLITDEFYATTEHDVTKDNPLLSSNTPYSPFEKLTQSTKRTQKKINRYKEGIRFALVIIVSYGIGNIFTNFDLYKERVGDIVYGQTKITYNQEDKEQVIEETNKTKNQKILSLFSNIEKEGTSEKDKLYAYFADKPKNIQYKFNTLPPDRRIIIPEIWVQSPIVNVDENAESKMQEWEFTDDLKKWVVHYPTTPNPGINGNMMLFGHSSNYRWIKSAYNTIFSKLPALSEGSEIIVIWDGKEYKYKVHTKEEVKPHDVPSVYARYHTTTKQLITLMTCYPVWTRDERMMVVAERIDNNGNYASNPSLNTDLAYIPNITN